MEEITFVDMMFHYEEKLKESSEGIQSIKNQINKLNAVIDSSWSGKAASACRDKLDFVIEELAKTESEISEALVKLSAVGEILVDGEN